MTDRSCAAGSPAGYLQVVLWVPVRIKDDAGVGSSEVDAQPARPRAQEKDEAVGVRLAEAVDGSLAQVPAHPPVDALIGVPAPGEERAGSQQGLNMAYKPFLAPSPRLCVGTQAAGIHWQDLCTSRGSGPISLCAL